LAAETDAFLTLNDAELAFRRLIATDASLSDKILAAFLARRALLMTGASSAIRVISSRFSPDSGRVREFLAFDRHA
jgi:thioredoxin reductase (NADPH)